MIGDCETAAVVSREGAIDWLCWPTFSSGAVFAALLGIRGHGFWKISPIGEVWSNHRRYEPHPLVVETTFETREGEVCLIDFTPHVVSTHVVRIVRGVRGKVAMQMELAIRFDYGRTIPWVTRVDTELHTIVGSDMVVLGTDAPLRGEGMTARSEITVGQGESVSLQLQNGERKAEGFPEKTNATGYNSYGVKRLLSSICTNPLLLP